MTRKMMDNELTNKEIKKLAWALATNEEEKDKETFNKLLNELIKR